MDRQTGTARRCVWLLALLLLCCQHLHCLEPCSHVTEGGNALGGACVFPFTYGGLTYWNCTSSGHSRDWCSTSDNYTTDGLWGNCVYDCDASKLFCAWATHGGSAMGAKCVFPFTYNGTSYESCTSLGHTQDWCATTDNYTADGVWGNCIYDCHVPDCAYMTTAGDRCVFPFIYQGTAYFDCITLPDGATIAWCATTDNYDRDGKSGTCRIPTTRENKECVFPFEYLNDKYYTCTSTSDTTWCGVTAIVDDSDGMTDDWGYCKEPDDCHFSNMPTKDSCIDGQCSTASELGASTAADCANGDCGLTVVPSTDNTGIISIAVTAVVIPLVVLIVLVIVVIVAIVWYRNRKSNQNGQVPAFYYEPGGERMKPSENVTVEQAYKGTHEPANGHVYENDAYSREG